jgi:hypothetical protein
MNVASRQFLKSAGAAALALACGITVASAETIVVERGPMPSLREEIIPIAPSPNHHWVHGHWAWEHGHWEWIAGHYHLGVVEVVPTEVVEVVPARPGPEFVWIKGHHVWENDHWAWHHGIWVH